MFYSVKRSARDWYIKTLFCLMYVMLYENLSAQIKLQSSSFSSGSATIQSQSYILKGNMGQPLVGTTSSASFKLQSGFGISPVDQLPDLIITQVNVAPSSVSRGQDVTVSFTVKNNGSQPAIGKVSVKVYLSLNASLDASDIVFTTFDVTSDLAAGSSYSFPGQSQSGKVNVTSTTPLDAYSVLLVADPDNTIAEKNETNNREPEVKSLTISTTPGDAAAPALSQFATGVFTVGKLSVDVTDVSGVSVVKFFHRPIASAIPFIESAMTNSNATYSINVEDGFGDELGMEGYVYAEDNAGNVTTKPNPTTYWYRKADPLKAIPLTSAFDGTTNTYVMFSVPYVLENKTINAVFDELGGYDKTKWRVFRFQGGKYVENEDGLSNVDAGKGYWINMKEKTEIKMGEGQVVPANQSDGFKLTLEAGWNQIGNPYPFNINWQSIKDANATVGLNSLWLFQNGEYVKKDVLASWKGAFVFSDKGGTVSFPVASKTTESGRVSQSEFSASIDESEWQLSLQLKLNDLRQASSIGMHPKANLSKDKFDEITVPRFIDYLEMNTHHQEFFAPSFSTDIVPTNEKYTWSFKTTSNQQGKAVLSWDSQSIAANQSQLLLLDEKDNTLINMKSVGEYSFDWSDERTFKLMYNRKDEFYPAVVHLGQAYPNPFIHQVTIPVFTEEKNQRVQVDVYDLLGRKIKHIEHQLTDPGLYQLPWDGRDEQGHTVAPGVLLYRINGTLSTDQAVRKLIKN